ncbi:50S ribosomal protein L19 [Chlamydia psittaci]|uniref:50S ribosomal protein L19 n=1 Tax=Chlamydia psittaci TaxID=83554 RepID=UPI00027E1663|nr:50S ribosomal protein L19 [Chlamydia psittaci]EPJ25860.1 ribosomal protein L19 [Chlamydia psittaci 09DC77]EPJ30964.1 ribosomal protein L19 [Chlamydia psittaci 09DC78]EPL00912.1 ribosomal protein L19 [Chlamydia psittaci 09DC79]AFS21323.1 ribosomal protein L19 [Chlamydia psittaci MN]AFS27150.1 ribosomal protein L19 [Chlamydia psittaci CP3]
MGNLIKELQEEQLRKEILTDFCVGDTIRVATKILDGGKERTQTFQGTVMARKGGGAGEVVSLHRVAYGEGMEKSFLLHSPKIVGIEVVKRGKVSRARLYYLKGKTGKAAKVKEYIGPRSSKK